MKYLITTILTVFLGVSGMVNAMTTNASLKVKAVRLTPGEDLKLFLDNYAKENTISSGFIITCVGSLNKAELRMAGAKKN